MRSLLKDRKGAGYLSAVVLLIAVLMATIIGAIVFFAFANGITGTTTQANSTKTTVIGYAVTVFALLAIVPLVMVGGLMLRSLGFMGGGGEV
jgi:predicted permease